MSFSPPASMRNGLTWSVKTVQFKAELQSIAAQNHVARNEDRTRGANLVHLGAMMQLPVAGTKADLAFSVQNLFNTAYHNHLSFYRKVEIPEQGRNIQVSIKLPFKLKLV
jgi:iron complex outermembrane receptor protein